MTLTALAGLDTGAPIETPVTFIFEGSSLVTVRCADAKPFHAFVARAQRREGTPCASGGQIMLGIVEAMIDRMADALERVGNEIDTLSNEVFRKTAVKANKKTRDLQSVIERIGEGGASHHDPGEPGQHLAPRRLSRGARPHARRARQGCEARRQDDPAHAVSLAKHARARTPTARLNFLLDATLGVIDLEQNQIIKISSVAAVVFLPPTLVASIYGMNFQVLPEFAWRLGYPPAIALMALSAAPPFLYFKRRGWL